MLHNQKCYMFKMVSVIINYIDDNDDTHDDNDDNDTDGDKSIYDDVTDEELKNQVINEFVFP